ncbi:MAG: hypothetical protein R3195_19795, partial [Gemmatimonadota bacterium]|nr:hypothetical protein [Gemmatimonadota bacterium]
MDNRNRNNDMDLRTVCESDPVARRFVTVGLAALALTATACSSRTASVESMPAGEATQTAMGGRFPEAGPPSPDPRVGLGAGVFDAEEAIWNLRAVSHTRTPEAFLGVTNSDLAFKDNYAIQGNYNGIQIWDIANPSAPVLVKGYVCPASQSDVSVYDNLLFVSGEGLGGRLDCGT